MDLDEGTVQRHGLDLHTDDLSLLQLGKDAIQYAALRPAVHARIDRVPVPELFGEATPFAALLGDVQDRVQDLQIVERDVAALGRQASLDVTILSLGEFHVRSIAQIGPLVLTVPSTYIALSNCLTVHEIGRARSIVLRKERRKCPSNHSFH